MIFLVEGYESPRPMTLVLEQLEEVAVLYDAARGLDVVDENDEALVLSRSPSFLEEMMMLRKHCQKVPATSILHFLILLPPVHTLS